MLNGICGIKYGFKLRKYHMTWKHVLIGRDVTKHVESPPNLILGLSIAPDTSFRGEEC